MTNSAITASNMKMRPWSFALGAEEVATTIEQIEALRIEAGEAGDLEQVALCERAIEGDEAARRACERVILAARAQVGT